MKQQRFRLKRLHTFLLFMLAAPVFSVTAQTEFTGFSVNAQNDLLFSVRSKNKQNEFYETLFLKRNDSETFEQLTFYPEDLEAFADGKILQVSNKLGTVTLDMGTGEKQTLKTFSLFENGTYKQSFDSVQVSPSGRYVSIVEPTDYVFGNLILFDVKTGKRFFIMDGVLQHEKPILWAPDDSAFVFEKAHALYFSRPTWLLEMTQDAEQNKPNAAPSKRFTAAKIAETVISAVQWIDKNTLCVIDQSKIYTINANKVLTSSLYDSFVQIKKEVHHIPFEFSSACDRVYFNNSTDSLLLLKEKKHLYFWDFQAVEKNAANASIPYLLLPPHISAIKVFWNGKKPIVWFEITDGTDKKVSAWKVENNAFVPFKTVADESVLSISTDARFALIKKNKSYSVKNLLTDKTVIAIRADTIVSSIWLTDDVLIIGTDSELTKIDVAAGKTEMLLISQVADFSWSKDEKKILAKSKSSNAILENAAALYWYPLRNSAETTLQPKKSHNKNYRVYIDRANRIFSNMIYFRSVRGLRTEPLVKNFSSDSGFEPRHAQTASKKVALIFDVMENTGGLADVLFTLQKNNTPATFFLTSEVIEHAPAEIAEIVRTGQQCASLFLAPLNVSDSKYTITDEFITRGLARTEDVFFTATKAELSLFWHTPYYVSSQAVIAAAKNAGYEFVLPTLILPDWIDTDDEHALPCINNNSYALVNYIMENISDNAIIPIQLGSVKNRSDYLYDRLDLLLDLLATYGYEVVPLHTIPR